MKIKKDNTNNSYMKASQCHKYSHRYQKQNLLMIKDVLFKLKKNNKNGMHVIHVLITTNKLKK